LGSASAEWLNYQLYPIKILAALVLTLLISTAGGCFHFITVQGRHLFKKTTFTVSTLPRAWLEPRANRILAFHPHDALRGLKAHGTALSFVPPKTFCYSRWTRRAPAALHRTKKIGLYFRGVAAFRSNQRGSASN